MTCFVNLFILVVVIAIVGLCRPGRNAMMNAVEVVAFGSAVVFVILDLLTLHHYHNEEVFIVVVIAFVNMAWL